MLIVSLWFSTRLSSQYELFSQLIIALLPCNQESGWVSKARFSIPSFWRSVNFAIIFGVFEFFRKTNQRILLTTMATCFRSFFGRNWRHQKSFWSYLTFNTNWYFIFQVTPEILNSRFTLKSPIWHLIHTYCIVY